LFVQTKPITNPEREESISLQMEIKDLKFQRNKMLTDMSALAGKPWTQESRSAFDKMSKEVEIVEADIARAESMASFDAESRSFQRSARPGTIGGNSADETRSRVNDAFRSYAKTGQIRDEYRSLLTTSDVTGGALIPQEFYGTLVEALKYYGPIGTKVRQKITNNNGSPMKIAMSNDTANGLVLLGTEGTSGPVETDPAFQSQLLGVDTVTGGLVKVSFQELEDSSFDLDTWLRQNFGSRYGRGIETAITTGKDSAGTTLPNQANGGLLSMATSVAAVSANLAAGIGWNDLTALFSALDSAYTITPSWVMNSATRSYLIGLKDGFGKPYFLNDPSNSAPFQSIMGFPIVLNQAMPNMGTANATPILFGDLDKSYMLRTDGEPSLLRLNERFADQLLVGFFLYSRIGGCSLAPTGVSPIVKLRQAAS